MTAKDWSQWRLLRRQALCESPAALGATLEGWSGDGDTEERWRQRLDEVPVNLVAEKDGASVGMVSVTETAHGLAEIISMRVSLDARGCGAGDALLRAAVHRARAAGASRVTLNLWVNNEHAAHLYRRAGFVDVGSATPPDAPNLERRMELDLRQVRSG